VSLVMTFSPGYQYRDFPRSVGTENSSLGRRVDVDSSLTHLRRESCVVYGEAQPEKQASLWSRSSMNEADDELDEPAW